MRADYHCGNGSASIFYEDAHVLVASLHACPNTDYPYNTGFAVQTGAGAAAGATLNVPLPPHTTWSRAGDGGSESYEAALRRVIAAVAQHGAQALIISLGVDAYEHDPVHLPGAGIKIALPDFERMGEVLGEVRLPTYLVQEGGYKLDVVCVAVRNVLRGVVRTRGRSTVARM